MVLITVASSLNLVRLLTVPKNHFTHQRYRTVLREKSYKYLYRILEVEDESDQETVRRAFLALVKRYHPDSGSPEANSEKFLQIEQAYRELQSKFASDRHNKCEGEYGLYYDESKHKQSNDVKEYDIKHTAPQHRQYLSYDGQGVGTPSERLKQHQKLRASTAIENVYQHRVTKLQSGQTLSHEDSLIIKDKKRSKNIKTRYGMERLVEDLIQESMARGDFNNLRGSGKPLKQYNEYNPYVDFVTHKINQIMIDNGFMPEWITLQKEIKEEADYVRSILQKERTKFGPPPLSEEEESLWNERVLTLSECVNKMNKKIEKFNLVVPILKKQMLLFNLDKESQKALMEGKPKEKSVKQVPVENEISRSRLSTFFISVLRKL